MKKAFTLVELLAVIILLGVVAFLTIRSISGVVRQAQEDSKEINVERYIKIVNDSLIYADEVLNGTYPIMSNGNVCIGSLNGTNCNGTVLNLKLSGDYPKEGTVTITDYMVTGYDFVLNGIKQSNTTTLQELTGLNKSSITISSSSSANLSNAGFVYQNFSFSGKTIKQIDIPVKTVSALDGNQTFTVLILDKSTVGANKVATIKRTITLTLPEAKLKTYSSTTINDWISLTGLNVVVGSDEELGFATSTDTVKWGYNSSSGRSFYNRVDGTRTLASQGAAIYIGVYE